MRSKSNQQRHRATSPHWDKLSPRSKIIHGLLAHLSCLQREYRGLQSPNEGRRVQGETSCPTSILMVNQYKVLSSMLRRVQGIALSLPVAGLAGARRTLAGSTISSHGGQARRQEVGRDAQGNGQSPTPAKAGPIQLLFQTTQIVTKIATHGGG